ncbi:efflux pump [Aspergillus sclerotialis]|uniref:Efflux pump n=1 Tax=Aspergillus sclerotialis TaxID=2070753 RepID=A0A3A2ZY68_9EURO|nr:efflux pump [Aspergillus sclerotialis]
MATVGQPSSFQTGMTPMSGDTASTPDITGSVPNSQRPTEKSQEPGNSGVPRGQAENEEYPPTYVALTIMASCLISIFLVSLDRTIVSTAIPYITDEFQSINDIGWYGCAYMLANCAVQLLYGKIYKLYSVKNVFFGAIIIFEVGSVLCGAAPTSKALIIGGAIAGAGSSGVMSGVMQIMVHTVPLAKRPIYSGLFSSVFGISSVVGPLLGGAFTERVSWRWCFYINLPFGAVSIVAVFFLMKAPPAHQRRLPFKERLDQLDPIGLLLFIPCIVCLILALQWGGVVYSWSNARIIVLWVVFGITLIIWIAVQAWKKDNATVPPRAFFQRSILASFSFAITVASSMIILVYYVPLWFQAVKGVSPVKSGLTFLPFVLALVVAAIIGGLLTQRIGYYVPTMPNTGHPRWIGLQVLCGFGIGIGMQQANLAAQTVLPRPDVPVGIALMFFAQQLGGAIFLAVGQSVFTHGLINGLTGVNELNPGKVAEAGATQIRNMVPESLLPKVLAAYNIALTQTWYISVGLMCASIVPTLCMEWKNIKRKEGTGKPQTRGTSVRCDSDRPDYPT